MAIIAIDKDEVIADFFTPFLRYIERVEDIRLARGQLTHFDLTRVLNVSQHEVKRILDEFHRSEEYKSIQPLEGSQNAIQQLQKKHALHLVTGAAPFVAEEVRTWTENHFPNAFTDVHFAQSYASTVALPSKVQICRSLNASIIVDDSLDFAIPCAQAGIKVILMHKRWNEQPKKKDEEQGIRRVNGWPEALQQVERLTRASQSQY